MKRRIPKAPYVFLFGSLFLLFNIPDRLASDCRLKAVHLATPIWKTLNALSTAVKPKEISKTIQESFWEKEMQLLVDEAKKSLELQDRENPFFQRRKHYLQRLLDKYTHAVAAKVVFRDPASWSSFVWVDAGEKANRQLGVNVICKNSPVLSDGALAGIVEEVHESRSKIRLISDQKLSLSVRAIRGGMQHLRPLSHAISQLRMQLSFFQHLNSEELDAQLKALEEKIHRLAPDEYMAKGELRGMSRPLWHAFNQTLQGVGFNYDFGDEEGPARNLRTGVILSNEFDLAINPLIKIGDLLVTTGMDGMFPADLPVAYVTQIFPLKEGECSYRLEAAAVINDLHEITSLLIISP